MSVVASANLYLIPDTHWRVSVKAYLVTAGVVFGLLTLAHVWRIIVEGPHVANPWFILITLVAAALSLWAWLVLWRSSRS
jgi:hypothetical protein